MKRWATILVALSATSAHADDAAKTIAAASKPASASVDAKSEKQDKKPKQGADKSGKKSAKAALDAIKPEPTEHTNDPIVGRASRITGNEASGLITFTFDDGPDANTTPAVLDALKKYDVPATFFIVTRRLAGKHGEKPRELLARTIAEGHLIASHSVSHPYLGKATAKLLDKEMDASFKALSEEAKRPIGLFRAPFGAMSPAGRARLKKLGVTEAFWSIDTLDWKAKDAAKLRKKAAAMIEKQNGGVILWHDVKKVTAEIIDDVLDDLEAANCKRLAAKQEPIWPVSIHYFLRDGKEPRAIPDDVKKRTAAYKAALPGRCAKRPPPEKPEKPEKSEKPEKAAAKAEP